MFSFALPILNEPQVYVGIMIFLAATISFIIVAMQLRQFKQEKETEKA